MTNAVPWEGPPAAAGPVMPSAGSGRTDSSAVRSDPASCGQPSRSPPGWGSAPGPARSRAPGQGSALSPRAAGQPSPAGWPGPHPCCRQRLQLTRTLEEGPQSLGSVSSQAEVTAISF